jgi:hypothetical protein
MHELVSTTEAAQRAGVTYRQLESWVHEGMIRPTHYARGSGHSHGFTEQQVDNICCIGRVVRDLEGVANGPLHRAIGLWWDDLESYDGPLMFVHGCISIELRVVSLV